MDILKLLVEIENYLIDNFKDVLYYDINHTENKLPKKMPFVFVEVENIEFTKLLKGDEIANISINLKIYCKIGDIKIFSIIEKIYNDLQLKQIDNFSPLVRNRVINMSNEKNNIYVINFITSCRNELHTDINTTEIKNIKVDTEIKKIKLKLNAPK